MGGLLIKLVVENSQVINYTYLYVSHKITNKIEEQPLPLAYTVLLHMQ